MNGLEIKEIGIDYSMDDIGGYCVPHEIDKAIKYYPGLNIKVTIKKMVKNKVLF